VQEAVTCGKYNLTRERETPFADFTLQVAEVKLPE
jgi:hypothetical protein